MSEWSEFRPVSSLLNPKFDGYRLSLDPLAQYTLKFNEDLQVQKQIELDSNLYTVNGIKAFRSINQLYSNRWKSEQFFYFFDRTHSIQRITILPTDSFSNLQQPTKIYQLPSNSIQGSLFFVSETLVVVSDGRSKLFLINTTEPKWQLVYEHDFDEFLTSPIRLLHAVYCPPNSVHALIGYIDKECHLLWATFSNEPTTTNQWTLTRRRLLRGKNWPEFTVLESSGHGLYAAIEGVHTFIFDSLIQVKPETPIKELVVEKIESPLNYIWSQTIDGIELEIQLPTGNQSHQWSVKIESNHLTCLLDNELLIDGTLFETVNVKESTYNVVSDKNNELIINLQKSKVGYFWNEVLKEGRSIPGSVKLIDMGDASRQMEIDEDIKQPYNSQQLEECDQYSNENDLYLYRFDGDNHKVTHQGLITNQILFTQTDQSSICIRHDVDGLIWQLDNITEQNQRPWHHQAALHAFGYVQASKSNRKFICAPTDYSYAAIIDAHTHIYIYKQKTPTSNLAGSSLKNRKTGQIVDTISKQCMVSLENHDEILGVTATNERLFVLLGDRFVIITI